MLPQTPIFTWRLLFLACGSFLLSSGLVHAAFPAPCETNFPTREAYQAEVQALNRQAEASLREKIEVGKERFEQRMQFRQVLVDAQQARATAREQQILAQVSPQRASPREPSQRSGRYLALLGVLTCAAFLGWQALRRASEDCQPGR